MYRQKIDITNIKSYKTIVILINALNQEGIGIDEDCGTSGKRKHQVTQQKKICKVVLKQEIIILTHILALAVMLTFELH